ncbi:hypothetical protein OESDEN_02820 [Oesophagostomum dentatum]|uniref:Uncharacterized protein n=1 Tax=Oesophagostomum dentatum TaxID=61180 RepID=A0A0B1TIZ7_OESDE|nr:hypothetical protein OESDEN_02820 [Oesophagostomum dentatum]
MSNGGVHLREDKSNYVSRPVSALSGIDFNEESSYPTANSLSLSSPAVQAAQFTQNVSGSPTVLLGHFLCFPSIESHCMYLCVPSSFCFVCIIVVIACRRRQLNLSIVQTA